MQFALRVDLGSLLLSKFDPDGVVSLQEPFGRRCTGFVRSRSDYRVYGPAVRGPVGVYCPDHLQLDKERHPAMYPTYREMGEDPYPVFRTEAVSRLRQEGGGG